MINITGGKFNRKHLETISDFVRPTASITREAFFSIIESYATKNSFDLYSNKVFLDLFSGIGTMGLEAISRGIERVIFYESNEKVVSVLEKNCLKFCKKDQYEIIIQNLENTDIKLNFENVSIIYIDPPYNKYNISNLLKSLQNKINKRTIIGLETSIKDVFDVPDSLKLIKQKKYGKTNLNFLMLS